MKTTNVTQKDIDIEMDKFLITFDKKFLDILKPMIFPSILMYIVSLLFIIGFGYGFYVYMFNSKIQTTDLRSIITVLAISYSFIHSIFSGLDILSKDRKAWKRYKEIEKEFEERKKRIREYTREESAKQHIDVMPKKKGIIIDESGK